MNPAIESFLERPLSHKLGAWFGVFALCILLYWMYSYKPQHAEYAALEEKSETLAQKIADETRRARNLNKLREKVKELDIKLKFVLQELPDESQIPDLLSSISNLARDAGLEVQLFRPSDHVIKDFYAEVPVSISVEGNYHQVATFFDEVAQLSRIVNINQIEMRDPQVSETEVRAKTNCVATTFRYLSEAERAASENSANSSKRRRR